MERSRAEIPAKLGDGGGAARVGTSGAAKGSPLLGCGRGGFRKLPGQLPLNRQHGGDPEREVRGSDSVLDSGSGSLLQLSSSPVSLLKINLPVSKYLRSPRLKVHEGEIRIINKLMKKNVVALP